MRRRDEGRKGGGNQVLGTEGGGEVMATTKACVCWIQAFVGCYDLCGYCNERLGELKRVDFGVEN